MHRPDLPARESVDLSRIGFSDPAVYAEIQDADTVGVFQIESRAQMQSLLQTRPESLDDLTIQVALIRPGPVSGGAAPHVSTAAPCAPTPASSRPTTIRSSPTACARRSGWSSSRSRCSRSPWRSPASPPAGGELRRAMSRKRSREAMVALWRDFRDGAREQGVDDETTRTVFRKLIGFSNFGFPKAHSSAFAVLAYQSAWLRQRYPAEFLASLMNAQPMGFYPPATLVRDAQRRGVRVLPPCIARSDAICTVEDGAVRVGLGRARGARGRRRPPGRRAAPAALPRHADLAARADLRREQLAQLVRAGACDALDRPRRAMLWSSASGGRALGRGLRSRSDPSREAPPSPSSAASSAP